VYECVYWEGKQTINKIFGMSDVGKYYKENIARKRDKEYRRRVYNFKWSHQGKHSWAVIVNQ
jgi:hypothetical protein